MGRRRRRPSHSFQRLQRRSRNQTPSWCPRTFFVGDGTASYEVVARVISPGEPSSSLWPFYSGRELDKVCLLPSEVEAVVWGNDLYLHGVLHRQDIRR